MVRLNYYWRLLATGLSFTLFGLGGLLIPLLAAPIIQLAVRDTARRQFWARKLVQKTFLAFLYIMKFLGVMTWDIKGLSKLHGRGGLVVANHPTLIDVVLLIAAIPNADCVVKGRLRDNPSMAGFIRLTGFIGNDAGPELLDEASGSIKNGSVLIIFPEGTRTVAGQAYRFQRGASNIAIRAQVDVTPVIIRCEPPTLSKGNKWYQIPERKFHIAMDVKDDIAISPYLQCSPSLGARQLTRDLESYFAEEMMV